MTRILAITDLHLGPRTSHAHRLDHLADLLLLKVVMRANRYHKPDVVVVLGDCIEHPNSPNRASQLQRLHDQLDRLTCPWLVIPGNHDPDPKTFYKYMPKPARWVDIGPTRILPLIDDEAPDFNATRPAANLQAMLDARANHAGPLVVLQHVPLLPTGSTTCAYGYTNHDQVMQAMRDAQVTLTAAGHGHTGTPVIHDQGSAFLMVPALAYQPFQYSVIEIAGANADATVTATHHRLKLPEETHLSDTHSHTQFAYCSENMDTRASADLARAMGLESLVWTEHSGQLYFKRETYWSGRFASQGLDYPDGQQDRAEHYWQVAEAEASGIIFTGLEVDATFAGDPIVRPSDRARCAWINGAVHFLPEERKTTPPDPKVLTAEFLAATAQLVTSGIDALAHPYRIFRRARVEPPRSTYPQVVKLLRDANVAAEINYHTNEPDPDFFRMCVEAGVQLTLGSDAHNLYEIGEFYPHMNLLRTIGIDPTDPASRDILRRPTELRSEK